MLVLLGPTLEQDYAERLRQRIGELTTMYPGLAGRIVLHPACRVTTIWRRCVKSMW